MAINVKSNSTTRKVLTTENLGYKNFNGEKVNIRRNICGSDITINANVANLKKNVDNIIEHLPEGVQYSEGAFLGTGSVMTTSWVPTSTSFALNVLTNGDINCRVNNDVVSGIIVFVVHDNRIYEV